MNAQTENQNATIETAESVKIEKSFVIAKKGTLNQKFIGCGFDKSLNADLVQSEKEVFEVLSFLAPNFFESVKPLYENFVSKVKESVKELDFVESETLIENQLANGIEVHRVESLTKNGKTIILPFTLGTDSPLLANKGIRSVNIIGTISNKDRCLSKNESMKLSGLLSHFDSVFNSLAWINAICSGENPENLTRESTNYNKAIREKANELEAQLLQVEQFNALKVELMNKAIQAMDMNAIQAINTCTSVAELEKVEI